MPLKLTDEQIAAIYDPATGRTVGDVRADIRRLERIIEQRNATGVESTGGEAQHTPTSELQAQVRIYRREAQKMVDGATRRQRIYCVS